MSDLFARPRPGALFVCVQTGKRFRLEPDGLLREVEPASTREERASDVAATLLPELITELANPDPLPVTRNRLVAALVSFADAEAKRLLRVLG